jgi:molybdopterin converting factor small subunit
MSVRRLEVDLLKTTGQSYKSLLLQRQMELLTLTDEERIVKQQIYAAEDLNNTRSLELELMELTGRAAEVTTIKRQQELDAMSATDAALKLRIFRLQDEKTKAAERSAIEQKLYTAMGDSSKVLALQRQQELDAADDATKAALKYQYALEDESSIREKLIESRTAEVDSIKSTIDSLEESINTLKDYRNALLNSEKSILTPQQKYAQAKQEATSLAAIAISTATTEAEKQAQKDAISKLPAATDTWLEASRTLFASSEAYTSDFNSVLSILDTTSMAMQNQKTEAEVQIELLQSSTDFLGLISESTKTTAQLLQEYLEAVAFSTIARDAYLMGSASYMDGLSVPTATANISMMDQLAQLASSVADTYIPLTSPETAPLPPTDVQLTDPTERDMRTLNVVSENNSILNDLKDQLIALRKEQAEQTQQLIATNAAVTQQAATVIGETYKDTVQETNWNFENGPDIQA